MKASNNPRKAHRYAVKYLDDQGNITGYGYAESMDAYQPGQIIDTYGSRILIDFEI